MTHQLNPRPIDLALLRLVTEGLADPLDLGVAQRLAVLRARYGTNPHIGPIIRVAWDAVLRATERADEAFDRAYLEGLLGGTEELLSEETFPRMAPMFTKYAEGSDMLALVEKVAEMFGEAVQEVAAWALAGIAIDEAQRNVEDQ